MEQQVVLGAQARQVEIDIGRSDIERRRVRIAELRLQRIERFGQRHFLRREIETGDRVVVEKTAADFRRSAKHGDRLRPAELL